MIFEQIYSALSVHLKEIMAVSMACCCGELSAFWGQNEIRGGKQWK